MEEEEKFEAFLAMLEHMQTQPRAQIINPKRMVEMQSAYNTLSKIVLDVSPDAKINCVMHELNAGNAVIRIETDELIVENVSEFIKSIENANNFEIYPLKGGKIKIAIMFYGVMKEL